MAAPKSQTITQKSRVAAQKSKDATLKSLIEARKSEEETVGQRQKFVMKGSWRYDMKEWQQSDVLEKQYGLKDGAIIRWCALTPIPGSYYSVNCKGFFVSPDLVTTYHLQMEKNKVKQESVNQ